MARSKLDRLKVAVAKYDETADRYVNLGAADTEPEGVFQELLTLALNGKPVEVPEGPRAWQLYREPGADRAARALTAAARKCVDLIGTFTVAESGELREYLEGYCWRCSI
jgi:hypothetical protein